MTPLRFDHTTENDVNIWRYVARPEERCVDFDAQPEWEDGGPSPYELFAVNNNNRAEMAVYLGLAWRLTAPNRFGIPNYWREKAELSLGPPIAEVDWEYDVCGDEFAAHRDNGFVRPRVSNPSRHTPATAGLFPIHRFQDLTDIVAATLGDASGEATFFGTDRADNVGRLAAALRAPTRPSLDLVLSAQRDVLVDLAIGVDQGYVDVITVACRDSSLGTHLEVLCDEYRDRIIRFEAVEASTMTGYCSLLSDLAGGGA